MFQIYRCLKKGDSMKKYPIFVYGTLMQGFANSSLFNSIEEKIVYGDTRINNCALVTYHGGFPYLIPGDSNVYGDIFYIDELNDKNYSDILKRLDGLEGEGTHYRRVLKDIKVTIHINPSEFRKVWVYIPTDDTIRRLNLLQLKCFSCWRDFVSKRDNPF